MMSGLAPAFRLWLIFQALDDAGRGCHDISDIYHLLTAKRSRWQIYKSKRAVRHILAQGEGIFWHRHTDDRLWRRSPDKVADALGCGRLRGMPVLLPFKPMLGSIGNVKAHLFASYESGRRSDAPISRAALADKTGVSERAQRDYRRRLGQKAEINTVITGLEYNRANIQETSGRLMRRCVSKSGKNSKNPVFPFRDWLGKRGPVGAVYVAYRIADTRRRCHKQAAKGRLRKINRAIDLVNNPTRGKHGQANRAYHPSAEKAAAAYNRDPETDHYYHDGGVNIWGVLLS